MGGLPAGPLAARPADWLLLLGATALVPVLLVTLTSFLKISVVLSVLRSALGAPQVPPTTAVTGLALVLTLAVMAPVGEAAWAAARTVPPGGDGGALASGARALVPLKAFLARFARADDREVFLDLARRLRPGVAATEVGPGPGAEVGADDLTVLAPAFMVSELRRAFTIGFLVFLPFLVVDLVVANVLLALGLTQLSPTSVALPLKLLLLVAVDGWRLLARGLALAYAPGGDAVTGTVLHLGREALLLALLLSAPPLLAALLVGLVTGLLQAATQLQEHALGAVPRIAAVIAALLVTGPWIGARLARFAAEVLALAAGGVP